VVWLVALAAGLILYWIYPRQLFLLIGLAVSGVVVVSVWHLYLHQARQAALDDVSVAAGYDGERRCTVTQPVAIEIMNTGNDTLEAVTFELVGRRPGHGGTLYTETVDNGVVVPPDGSWTGCLALRHDGFRTPAARDEAHSLDWSTTLTSADFR